MGIGKDKLGNTYSVTYHDGTGNIRGATYATITTQGHLNLIDSGVTPTSPSTGKITIFAEEYAGRVLPSAIGPSGVDYVLQAALYGNTNYVWLAGSGVLPAIAWGTAWTALNSGTGTVQSHPIKASTNAMTSLNRANFSTGSTGTGVSGVRSSSTTVWLGNAAGLGGFLFFARFGVETVSGTYRALVGLSLNTSVLGAAVEPSALAAAGILLIKDTTDTTWQIFVRSATGANAKINTGIPVTAGDILDLYIHSAPNSQSVKFYIKNGATGADLYSSPSAITTNVPGNTLFLYAQIQIASTTGTTPKLIALNKMYLETDL